MNIADCSGRGSAVLLSARLVNKFTRRRDYRRWQHSTRCNQYGGFLECGSLD